MLGCIPMVCVATCCSIDYYELLPNGDLQFYKVNTSFRVDSRLILARFVTVSATARSFLFAID